MSALPTITYILRNGSFEVERGESWANTFDIPEERQPIFQASSFDEVLANPQGFHLFEWQQVTFSYICDLTDKISPPFSLHINQRKIKESKQMSGVHFLTAPFSFKDQVGESIIELLDGNGLSILKLELEVFPQKMDYRTDMRLMIEEIAEISHDLAFLALRDTFKRARLNRGRPSTLPEAWAILDELMYALQSALDLIVKHPHREMLQNPVEKLIHKVKQGSSGNTKWMAKAGRYAKPQGPGLKVGENLYFVRALDRGKHFTLDTFENRFVRWAVLSILDRLSAYGKFVKERRNGIDFHKLFLRIGNHQSDIRRFLGTTPLLEAGRFENIKKHSMVLTGGIGYREFSAAFHLLDSFLKLVENHPFKIEIKNVSALYEQWCFLKVVRLITEMTGCSVDRKSIIQLQAGKQMGHQLRKNMAIKLKGPSSTSLLQTVIIHYNKTFGKKNSTFPLFNQRPDIAIEFYKKGYGKPFWYLFDAKYQFDKETRDVDFVPPAKAIGQMHRYRDAILHSIYETSTYRQATKNLGGIILFPYPQNEEQFRSNPCYQAIEDVNIGALPFLPTKTNLVLEMLRRLLLEDTPESHFEQFIEMDKTEYSKKHESWKQWVTIGVIPKDHQDERFEFIREKRLIHMPFVASFHSRVYESKQIMMILAGKQQAIQAEVESWELATKAEMAKLGTTWEHRADLYILFRVRDLKELAKIPPALVPVRHRFATFEGLKLYLSSPEAHPQALFLNSISSIRLYEVLRNEGILFKINAIDVGEFPSNVVFEIKDLKIIPSETSIEQYWLNERFMSLRQVLGLVKDHLKLYPED